MTAVFHDAWTAQTAYALLAVVRPVTFTAGAHTWVCTTAGTSGSSEPTWPDPTTGTTTVTDGTVTWSAGTGFRQSIAAGFVSTMTPFQTANPTLVRSIRTERPRSYATCDLPCIHIGDMTETIAHSVGIRTRTLSGLTVVWMDQMADQNESSDRGNFMADVLTDYFTSNFHLGGAPSGFQQAGTQDYEVNEEGGFRGLGLLFTFAPNTSIAEGRN